LTRHRDPDLQHVIQTADAIARALRAGQLICPDSTTYQGNTHFGLATIPKVLGGMSDACIDPSYFCWTLPSRKERSPSSHLERHEPWSLFHLFLLLVLLQGCLGGLPSTLHVYFFGR
jgi:hypothetical protein